MDGFLICARWLCLDGFAKCQNRHSFEFDGNVRKSTQPNGGPSRISINFSHYCLQNNRPVHWVRYVYEMVWPVRWQNTRQSLKMNHANWNRWIWHRWNAVPAADPVSTAWLWRYLAPPDSWDHTLHTNSAESVHKWSSAIAVISIRRCDWNRAVIWVKCCSIFTICVMKNRFGRPWNIQMLLSIWLDGNGKRETSNLMTCTSMVLVELLSKFTIRPRTNEILAKLQRIVSF